MHRSHQDNSYHIRNLEKEVRELEHTRSYLLARVARVEAALASARPRLAERKNWLTPIYRLPDEMLLTCFVESIQFSKSSIKRWGAPVDRPVATDISHVSRRWRRLAINTPSLWTCVLITPRTISDEYFITEFLRRSANLPITFDCRDDEDYFDWKCSCGHYQNSDIKDHYDDHVIPLLPSLYRITALSWSVSGVAIQSLLSQFRARHASSTAHSFPALTSLTLTGTDDEFMLYHDLRNLAKESPNLRSITFEDCEIMFPTSDPPIILPSVESMTVLLDSRPIRRQHIFAVLSTPALRHLELGVSKVCPCPNVAEFLLRDGAPRYPTVRDLTLDSASFYGANIAQTLAKGFPHLTYLTVGRLPSGGLHLQSGVDGDPPVMAVSSHVTLDYHFLPSIQTLYNICRWVGARSNKRRQHMHIRMLGAVTNLRCLQSTDRQPFLEHVRMLQRYGELEGVDLSEVALLDAAESSS